MEDFFEAVGIAGFIIAVTATIICAILFFAEKSAFDDFKNHAIHLEYATFDKDGKFKWKEDVR